MHYRALLTQGLRDLIRNRLRTGLTVLGIAIGIAAVVCVVAIGNAGSAQIQQHLANLGDNLVWVESGGRRIGGVRTGGRSTSSLQLTDMHAILQQVPMIKSCSPNVDSRVQVVYGNQNWNTLYNAVYPEFLNIRRWRVAYGSWFGQPAMDNGASVVVIGETVRRYLFPREDPLGKTVRINQAPFTVMGVLASKGGSMGGRDLDDIVIVPFTTGQRKIEGANWVEDIMCSAVSPEAVKPAGAMITTLLRERHRILPGQDDDFNIRNPEDQIQAQLDANETMSLLLISIGAVSLLVGGIGIMNVMLVSVTERTREIGVRMAVGATESHVQMQFLSEAVLLCMGGGALGVLLGFLGTFGLSRILDWSMQLSAEALLLAAVFSITIGIFFGYYPAQKAARLDPIEALRYE